MLIFWEILLTVLNGWSPRKLQSSLLVECTSLLLLQCLLPTSIDNPLQYEEPLPHFYRKILRPSSLSMIFQKSLSPVIRAGEGGRGGRGSHYKYCYLLSPILEVAFREFSFSSILNSQVDICLKRKHPFFFCIIRLSFTCLKSTIETLEQVVKYFQSYWRCSGVFIVNFKHIWLLVLVFLLLTLNM